jgi:predicted alpha-1,6-mannanase (GH76 family)
MYGWVTRCLTSPEGLVYDHRGIDGSVNTAVWSYNQGAMIAVSVGLYRATGHRGFLRRARALAAAALTHFDRTGWAGEPACFVAIFFRDLRALDAASPDRHYAEAAREYGDARWRDGRDPATGLFSGSDSDRALLAQAGMVQLYAELAAR